MRKIRKHSAIPLFAVTLLIFTALLTTVFSAKDEAKFQMEDVYGDRSALQGVMVSGELGDGYHRTNFQVGADHVAASTDIKEIPISLIETMRTYHGDAKRIDEIDYEILVPDFYYEDYNDTDDFKIYYYDNTPGNYRTGMANLDMEAGDDRWTEESFGNSLDYGLTHMDSDIYYTVPASAEYGGMNGIYALQFNESNIPDDEQDTTRAVTTFSDDDFADEDIIGLEAAGDVFAVISAEEERLIIRGHDLNGEQLGEAVVEDFYLEGYQGSTAQELHGKSYTAYADENNGVLTISFPRDQSQPEERSRTVISIDLSDQTTLLDVVEANFSEEPPRHYEAKQMNYINGKLYVAQTLQKSSEDSQAGPDIFRPIHFMIHVYETGKLIYQGELKTDMGDDLNQAMQESNVRGSYGYGKTDNRTFSNLAIDQVERGEYYD